MITTGRRQFLIGAGGFALALPTLPSLLSSTALAQSRPRARFIAFASPHGCVAERNMYPRDQTLGEERELFGRDHVVRRGDLKLDVSNGRGSLSPVLTASSDRFTQGMASKMNVLRGFDLSWNIGHHTGGHLGNFARNDMNKYDGDRRPTIDQVMAWSPSFYTESDLRTIRQRSMNVGEDGRFSISWGYAKPASGGGSGDIEAVPSSYSSKDLFDAIFLPSNAPAPSQNKPIVDTVYESYRAAVRSPRLSKADRDQLEQHVNRISELQRRVNVVASCNGARKPERSVDKESGGLRDGVVIEGSTREFYETFNDVIAAAFMCGTSRIATIYPHGFTAYAGDWHQQIAHTAQVDGASQSTLAEENRRYFELFLDLASKLDVEEREGQTFLDNTLMMWTQESGPSTHDPIGLPVVTAGSAAGFLRTGMYADYRRTNGPKWTDFHAGILYNQWLGTVLQAMSIPANEYERGGDRGYGAFHVESMYGDPEAMWPARLRQAAGEVVPFLKV